MCSCGDEKVRLKDPFVIPRDRLPAGFAEQIERPPSVPAEPRPAATGVLMRDGAQGPEVLLLKRHRASGFVPGAFVFPGGRVDPADAEHPWTIEQQEPPADYWGAVLREIFEETGVLLARDAAGGWPASAASDEQVEGWREQLMLEQTSLAGLLIAEGLQPAFDQIVYLSHWITPVAEPRRYDTRFFLAHLPAQRQVRIDAREMTEAIWVTPAAALARFQEGSLPMVFPTVRTLQQLTDYRLTADALSAFRNRTITPILPRLVRTPDGVAIVIDEDMNEE